MMFGINHSCFTSDASANALALERICTHVAPAMVKVRLLATSRCGVPFLVPFNEPYPQLRHIKSGDHLCTCGGTLTASALQLQSLLGKMTEKC